MQEKNHGRMIRKQLERQLAMKMEVDARAKSAEDGRAELLQQQTVAALRVKEASTIADVGRGAGNARARRRVGL